VALEESSEKCGFITGRDATFYAVADFGAALVCTHLGQIRVRVRVRVRARVRVTNLMNCVYVQAYIFADCPCDEAK